MAMALEPPSTSRRLVRRRPGALAAAASPAVSRLSLAVVASLLLLSPHASPPRSTLTSASVVLAAEDPASRRKILSLGGNGMIGTSVLSKLLDAGGYDVVVASRGSWPFDSGELVKPRVRWAECDRSDRPRCHGEDGEESEDSEEDEDEERESQEEEECDRNAWRHACPDLIEAVSAGGDYWAVLDFSGYRGEWVWDALDALHDVNATVRVYVYVSTDSVYEVSAGGGPGARRRYLADHRRSREEDAVRPEDAKHAAMLARFDDYGHRKLEGEEVLERQRRRGPEGGGVPHASLRFGDVVGPRDGTGRYATCHVWARYVGRVEGVPPFHIEEDVVEASSVTYAEDAARAILEVIDRPESWNEAYNVGCPEVFNTTELLPTLGDILGRPPEVLGIEKRPNEDSVAMYPSITRGPMDLSKARGVKLGFEPTPLRTALEETVRWYEEFFLSDEDLRVGMVEEFVEDVLDEDDEDHDEVVARLWQEVKRDVREAQKRIDQDAGLGEEF